MAKDRTGTPLKVGDEVLLRAKVTEVTEDSDTGANATFQLMSQGDTKERAASFSGNSAFVTKAPASPAAAKP